MLTLLFYLLTITTIDGFKLDLIHRHSYISPGEYFLHSASSYLNIKLLHQKTEVQTTVTPNGGDYLVKVSVGTPPLELLAAASLANDLTWFQCEPCERCYQQKTAILNPASSKTYKSLPCDSEHCSKLDSEHISCNQKYNECRYWYSYGNATAMTMGLMGSDAFSFASLDGGLESFNSTVFGCGFEQSGLFDWASSGLVGLGGGPLSLVSQLGPKIGYKFSYCLVLDTSSKRTSTLRFGSSLATGQQTVTVPYFTKNPPSFYNLNLSSITIGSKSLRVSRDVIIDIGTTLTYVNPSIFSSLKAMVNEVIGVKPLPENQSESMLCYDTRAGTLTPPDIILHFSGGDLALNAENIFFESNGVVCLSIVMSEEDGNPMVLGNTAQVNLQVEYDLLNKTVSFTHKDCAKDQTVQSDS